MQLLYHVLDHQYNSVSTVFSSYYAEPAFSDFPTPEATLDSQRENCCFNLDLGQKECAH